MDCVLWINLGGFAATIDHQQDRPPKERQDAYGGIVLQARRTHHAMHEEGPAKGPLLHQCCEHQSAYCTGPCLIKGRTSEGDALRYLPIQSEPIGSKVGKRMVHHTPTEHCAVKRERQRASPRHPLIADESIDSRIGKPPVKYAHIAIRTVIAIGAV